MQVPRGHDQHRQRRIALLRTQGLREIVEQQMLDGRAGQHDPQLGKVIGQTGGELRTELVCDILVIRLRTRNVQVI